MSSEAEEIDARMENNGRFAAERTLHDFEVAGPVRTSFTVGQLAAALAGAQAIIDNPKKHGRADAGSYGYTYATLDATLEAVRKALAINGLALVQIPVREPTGWQLATRLIHSSGEWIENRVPLILHDDANMQEFGSAMTYARRYGMQALVGVAGEEDDDGSSASRRPARISAKAPTMPPKASAPEPPPHTFSDVESISGDVAAMSDTAYAAQVTNAFREWAVCQSKDLKLKMSLLCETHGIVIEGKATRDQWEQLAGIIESHRAAGRSFAAVTKKQAVSP